MSNASVSLGSWLGKINVNIVASCEIIGVSCLQGRVYVLISRGKEILN